MAATHATRCSKARPTSCCATATRWAAQWYRTASSCSSAPVTLGEPPVRRAAAAGAAASARAAAAKRARCCAARESKAARARPTRAASCSAAAASTANGGGAAVPAGSERGAAARFDCAPRPPPPPPPSLLRADGGKGTTCRRSAERSPLAQGCAAPRCKQRTERVGAASHVQRSTDTYLAHGALYAEFGEDELAARRERRCRSSVEAEDSSNKVRRHRRQRRRAAQRVEGALRELRRCGAAQPRGRLRGSRTVAQSAVQSGQQRRQARRGAARATRIGACIAGVSQGRCWWRTVRAGSGGKVVAVVSPEIGNHDGRGSAATVGENWSREQVPHVARVQPLFRRS